MIEEDALTFLSSLFGPRHAETATPAAPEQSSPLAQDAWKRATTLRQGGDVAAAAETLEAAIRGLEENPPRAEGGGIPEQYPELDKYLRLALYLQQAGRSDEGWRLLNRLLAGQFPAWQAEERFYKRQATASSTRAEALATLRSRFAQNQARVYDKMRLFLQRDGRHLHAVKMALLSYAATALEFGIAAQFDSSAPYPTMLRDMRESSTIRATVAKHTKKARASDLDELLVTIVSDWVAHAPDAELEDLAGSLATVLVTAQKNWSDRAAGAGTEVFDRAGREPDGA